MWVLGAIVAGSVSAVFLTFAVGVFMESMTGTYAEKQAAAWSVIGCAASAGAFAVGSVYCLGMALR